MTLILAPSDTLLCGCYANLYHRQSWSTTSEIYIISAPSVRKYSATKISKWEMCIQLFLYLILDKDKYKLSLEFDAIFGRAVDWSIAYMPSILAFLKLIFPFLNIVLL